MSTAFRTSSVLTRTRPTGAQYRGHRRTEAGPGSGTDGGTTTVTLDRFATGQTDDEQLNVFADRLAALMASLVYRATPSVALEPLMPVAHLTLLRSHRRREERLDLARPKAAWIVEAASFWAVRSTSWRAQTGRKVVMHPSGRDESPSEDQAAIEVLGRGVRDISAGSRSQVAARRRLQRLSGADVALDEDVNASVAGLCGNSVDAHAARAALVA